MHAGNSVSTGRTPRVSGVAIPKSQKLAVKARTFMLHASPMSVSKSWRKVGLRGVMACCARIRTAYLQLRLCYELKTGVFMLQTSK